ncbi:MAG TPA: ABC transporter substrate-binding protein [Candidatus Methylomirabilis sp.]|nr:ABC transporter substrate-binding protein [Candidatus Methylomirabilis sp.]
MSRRKTSRREFLRLAVAGAGAAVMTGRSAARAATSPGRPLTVVQTAWPQSLDPSMDTNVNAGNMYAHIFESPAQYRYDAQEKVMKLEPRLCDKWENRAPDRWRFHLRPGLKFTNGEEINSDCAKFSMETIKGNKGMAAPFLAHVKEVVPVDKLSFDLVTEGPYAATPASTAFFFFFPPKYYVESGGKTRFGRKPIGSGPYRFAEWQEGVHIKLEANPAYWGPKPQIPAITFRAQSETATRVALLETGEADLITALSPELIDRVKRTADIRTARGLRRVFCFFNANVAPTDNPLVRKAINHAVDVEAIVKNVLEGHAYAAKGINKPGYIGYAPDKLTGYRYDPELAKKLLAQAGHPNGIDLDYNHPVGRWLNDKDVAAAIIDMAAKAGIRFRDKGVEFNTVSSLYTTQKATGMNMWSVGPLWLDPSYEWQVHFWTRGLYHYTNNAKMDGLLDRLRMEVDPAKRVPIAQEFEKYVVDEYCPWLFLYDEEHIYGANRKLQWTPSPFERMDLQYATVAA